jgi:hypothetical protein
MWESSPRRRTGAHPMQTVFDGPEERPEVQHQIARALSACRSMAGQRDG